MEELEEVKKISIKDFLERRGISFSREGHNFICRSPLSSDKTPSFYYYPHTNTFYDWANGVGGDIVKLVEEVDNVSFVDAVKFLTKEDFPQIERFYDPPKKEKFVLNKYLTDDEEGVIEIRKYAIYRGISVGYVNSKFYIKSEDELIRRIGIGFVHTGYYGEEVGIKIRDIDPYNGRRFTLRGEQKFYCLENNFGEQKTLYLVESETSANSLWMFLMKLKKPSIVISFGSWNNVPEGVPNKYLDIIDRRVIIDYDGNEELYSKRIERFTHLNAKEVKLELPKGEDINSLYTSGKIINFKEKII